MGEFQRSRSKVWWSNYLEGDTEDEDSHPRHWVLSPSSRGSSSSPSSSHKSQDSGFSDSEASSTPGVNGEPLKPSPLSTRNDSPIHKSDDEANEDCSSNQVNQSEAENKSPVKKLKGQLLSQCGCLGQSPQKSSSDNKSDELQVDKSLQSQNNNVDSSSQLPVRKLREKFLQDCICGNQEPERDKICNSYKDTSKSPQKVQQPCQNSVQPTNEETEESKTEQPSESISEQQDSEKPETPPSPPEILSRPASSLSRAIPVPTIRTPQNTHLKLNKESPPYKSPTPSPRSVKNKSRNKSPVPSPRNSKKSPNTPKECSESPRGVPESSALQSSPTQKNKESPNQRERPELPAAENKECQSARTVSSDIPDFLGSPSHTSTPKGSNTPNKFLTTPSRALRCLGLGKKSGRPVNLLNNFNNQQQSETADTEQGPVQQWLGELATLYEPECMTTLQSKSLAVNLRHQVAIMAAAATDTVKMLQDSTKLISSEFSKLCQQLEYGKMEHVGPLVQSLVGHVTEFLQQYCGKEPDSNKQLHVDEAMLVEVCDRLRLIAAKQPPDKDELTSEIATLGNKFTGIVDSILIQHISVLVGILEDPTSELGIRSALSSLTSLGLEGPHLSRLVAQCSGVRALLTVCLESQSSSVRTAALRALATLCCVVEAIRQLEQVSDWKSFNVSKEPASSIFTETECRVTEGAGIFNTSVSLKMEEACFSETSELFQSLTWLTTENIILRPNARKTSNHSSLLAGGVEIISDTLAETARPEPEVSEAAAVLAQITAPYVEDNHSVQGLSEQLPSLVKSLTRLASSTSSCETLLLAAAALANLTFMEPRAVWPLLENETAGKLLQAVKKRGPRASVFLQEQAATLLANMAAVPESRSHLAEQRAVVALLCFLQIRHSPLQRANEIAAAERVQQKSAIALSRLCSDQVVAAQVVELQGVNRLVRLCKEERERNHSDGVLVACLAALRKVAANCGTKVIEDLDAMELVEPRLLDSFLIYSSRQESYV